MLGQQVQGEEHMKYEDIKFFSERCEEHPDHQTGMVSHQMIQDRLSEEIDELRAYIESQLAQPEQEPVAWMDKDGDVLSASVVSGKGLRNIPLYTAPPKRTWVGLTDEEILEVWKENEKVYPMDRSRLLDRTRACIRKAQKK